MNVLVVYYSESGNTEKVARAIYDEVSRENHVDSKRVNEVAVKDLTKYDLIFLGSACHSSDLARPAKEFLNSLPENPKFKLAGFFTHATYVATGDERSDMLFDRWASKCVTSFHNACRDKQIDFKGLFNCQGAPSPPIEAFIKREVVTSTEGWREYIEEARSHPTSNDLRKAREFARAVIASLT